MKLSDQRAVHRVLLAIIAALVTGTVANQASAQGTIQVTYGSLSVDNGYSDRSFVGIAGSYAIGQNVKLQFDASHQSREEDASYLSLGVSRTISGGNSLGFFIGGSDSNLGIFPEFHAGINFEHVAPANTGLVYRASLTYSDYTADSDAIRLSGEIVKYFPETASGSYVVAQIGGSLVSSDPGSQLGWELNAVATQVRPDGWSFGVGVGLGTIGYELGAAAPVENDFVAVRPFVARKIGDASELILRGEVVNTDDYDIRGVSIGFKVGF